jgi:50S ribosomal protein L16 3-hydroxylase
MAIDIDQPTALLAGLSPKQFMRKHWQKKPLLVRGAFQNFKAPISIARVLKLCSNELAESRMITQQGRSKRWDLQRGPFARKEIPSVNDPCWTVLVQQVNTLLPEADRFLDHFRFVPEARLDDLMISVAGPNGGIGAHLDSYDVFLVQAAGKRRWEVSETVDPTLVPNVPLKILRNFKAEQDWVLEPGDMLYLPPGVAHRGTAVGPACMTWSIGFRAPNRVSLADNVWASHLDTLADSDWLDPWLSATDTPGEIPKKLLKAFARQVEQSLPDRDAIERAVACVLSEPAQTAVFEPPSKPDSLALFCRKIGTAGLRLAPASRLLYSKGRFFFNGEEWTATPAKGRLAVTENRWTATAATPPRGDDSRASLRAAKRRGNPPELEQLANQRSLSPTECAKLPTPLKNFVYRAFLNGWIRYDSQR